MRELLMEQVERERSYLARQTIGSDEYCASQRRLMDLAKQVSELDSEEKERKGQVIHDIFEGVKIGSGIVIPLIGLVWITATEKETTFTGVLKEYTRYFLPRKTV